MQLTGWVGKVKEGVGPGNISSGKLIKMLSILGALGNHEMALSWTLVQSSLY